MAIPNTKHDLDLVLDVFGQRLVTIFTQISFCFPTGHYPSSQDVILGTLTEGLQRLAQQFPWVAGQVICEGAQEGNTGTFKIKPLETTPRMSVKDLRNEPSMPSMDDLRRAKFPMKAFDEDLVAPRNSNSGRPDQRTAEVFQLQINFIKSGLILTFLGQHQAMDGIGQAQVVHLFSKACRNEGFTEKDLRIGNYAPENEVPVCRHHWEPGPELTHNIVKFDLSLPGFGSRRSTFPAENGKWSHFTFALPSLEALKSLATKTLPPASIIRARLPRLSHSKETLFARAVDLRRYLNIAKTHPGFVQSMTYHKVTPQQLVNLPLGSVAADLRAVVDPEKSTLAHDGRSFATLISRTPNKSLTSYLAGFDMSQDVMLSSWANQNSYDLDVGLNLGKAGAVRRPRFDSFQGLVYLLPKTPAGEISVVICLSDEDLVQLKADEDFTKYATFVG